MKARLEPLIRSVQMISLQGTVRSAGLSVRKTVGARASIRIHLSKYSTCNSHYVRNRCDAKLLHRKL